MTACFHPRLQSSEQLFEELRSGRNVDATFDRIVVQDLIDLAPPGLDELFALVSISDALASHDAVVVDTAPTGHALRLLALPPKALSWVHAILEILDRCHRVGTNLRLTNVPANIHRVFEMTGTTNMLNVGTD